MKKTLLRAALLALPLWLACQETEPEVPVDDYEATITFTNGSSVSIGPLEGDTANLLFSCDHEWTLDIPEDAAEWLSAGKFSGKSGKTIRLELVVAKSNDGPSRSATCRILSGSKKKKFTVSARKPKMICASAEKRFSARKTEFSKKKSLLTARWIILKPRKKNLPNASKRLTRKWKNASS